MRFFSRDKGVARAAVIGEAGESGSAPGCGEGEGEPVVGVDEDEP